MVNIHADIRSKATHLEVHCVLESHSEQTRSFCQMRSPFWRFIKCFTCPAKQHNEESNVCTKASATRELAGVSCPEGTVITCDLLNYPDPRSGQWVIWSCGFALMVPQTCKVLNACIFCMMHRRTCAHTRLHVPQSAYG